MSKTAPWQQAARDALQDDSPLVPATGRVERLSIDVRDGGQSELVSLAFRDGRLTWSCTCGQLRCRHAAAALRLLAGEASDRPSDPASATASGGYAPVLRTAAASARPDEIEGRALADVLEDVITAVVRAGVLAPESPSVDEALQRLVDLAPQPLPLGIGRWIGRLRAALDEGDVEAVAGVLDGASRVVDDLRAGRATPEASQRVVSWLGALARDVETVQRISDRVLIEVAREWLTGTERAAIERRYLVDLRSAEIYREERVRGAATASYGPCPRMVHVGLAEVEQGARPKRIRLLQYSVSTRIAHEAWHQLAAHAVPSFEALARSYREASGAFPGLAEPFAVVAPARYARSPRLVPVDTEGRPLPLASAEDPAALRYVDAETQHADPAWIAGRLVDADGVLMLLPASLGFVEDGRLRHRRVR